MTTRAHPLSPRPSAARTPRPRPGPSVPPSDEAAGPRPVVFTVGYGGRTADGLVKLLTTNRVAVVCDVRSTPRSRFVPWANYYTVQGRGPLKQLLTDAGFEYRWVGDALGNPKPRERAMTLFKALMRAEGDARTAELRDLARHRTVCLLCAAKGLEKCHRALITDVLARHGFVIRHLF